MKTTAPKRKAAERVQTVRSRSATTLVAKRALAKAAREVAVEAFAEVRKDDGCLPWPEMKYEAERRAGSENYWVALERVPARLRPVARRLVRSDRDGLLEEKYFLEPMHDTFYDLWKKRCKR